MFETNLNYATSLDKTDRLNKYREQFEISDEKTVYLDGNSLGRLPIRTKSILDNVINKQWGTELIESWNKNWYRKSVGLGDKIARLIGARKGEVIVSDNTSTNLYKLAHAALKYNPNRTEIVSDSFNFPTDLYILQGLAKSGGNQHSILLAESKDGICIDINDLKEKITPNTALVVLSLVAFKSSFTYDIREITDFAQKKGALVLWDLSHAAGAISINLSAANADLAVGCTYKYLNGGPGSPAFLYVRKDLQNKLESPIQGWFGHDQPFQFDLNFEPAKGIQRFLSGTPPVLNLMAIEPGVDMLLDAEMYQVQKKSRQLSEYFIFLVQQKLLKYDFSIGSPLNAQKRGSHVSLKHVDAYRICQALIHPKKSTFKVIPDFREPDNIRFGFTPLYTTFAEIWFTVERIATIMDTQEHESYSLQKKTVT